jgi:hypothetical protein
MHAETDVQGNPVTIFGELQMCRPQLVLPQDVWQFIDRQSECLGRGSSLPAAEGQRCFWVEQLRGAGGNGVWEHVMGASVLGEQLVITSGQASREISLVAMKPGYSGFLSTYLRKAIDPGSTLRLHAGTGNWQLHITSPTGESLYSTGENYSVMTGIVMSLGFFDQPIMLLQSLYETYMSELPRYVGRESLFRSDLQTPLESDESVSPPKNVINTRTNPQAAKLSESVIREYLGSCVPWGSIEAANNAVSEFTQQLSKYAMEYNTPIIEGMWSVHPRVIIHHDQSEESIGVRSPEEIIEQAIRKLERIGGTSGLVFKGFQVDLYWDVSQEVQVHNTFHQRAVGRNGDKEKYVWELDVDESVAQLQKRGIFFLSVDSRGDIVFSEKDGYELIALPYRAGLTSRDVIKEITNRRDSIIKCLLKNKGSLHNALPFDLPVITYPEMQQRFLQLQEMQDIPEEVLNRKLHLTELWMHPWDRSRTRLVKTLYSKNDISSAKEAMRNTYLYPHRITHSDLTESYKVPWTWPSEELIIRGLILEELAPWLFSQGIYIHQLENHVPGIRIVRAE